MRTVIAWWHKQKQNLQISSLAIIPDLTGRVTQSASCSSTAKNGSLDLVNCNLNTIYENASSIFFEVIAGLAVILLIWAGIQYVQALGNQDAVKKARQRIVNIFIGVVLLVAAYFVINSLLTIISYLARKA